MTILLSCIAPMLALFQVAAAISNPEELVSTLGGTASRADFSNGNTLPLVARPWGFNSWAPVTDNGDGTWWFHPDDKRYFGLKCTHQPSPWIGDYGQFRLVAMLNDPSHSGSDQFSGYKPSSSTWKPYYFNASLLAYGTSKSFTFLEFTPSTHGGIMHANFPEYEANSNFVQTRRIAIVLNKGTDHAEISTATDGSPMIIGKVTKNDGGVGSNFGHYFAAQVYTGVDGIGITQPIDSHGGNNDMAWLDFSPEDGSTEHITVRIATSLISQEQALENLRQEVNQKVSFGDLLGEAKDSWRDVLSRVDIKAIDPSYVGAERQLILEVFYSNLYRASLFPRQLSETNNNGKIVHWSPYNADGGVFPGVLTSDSGFWDAYITVYPYLTLIHPTQLGTTIQGWLNAYQEGEWLPKWASPGYRGSMVGSMGDVSLADAIVKNISGFDHELAYQAIRKDAFDIPSSGLQGKGRECLPPYLANGYIPRDAPSTEGGECAEVVSHSLNYMQADYAIAQAALTLGYTDDAAVLMARAMNYSLLFDGSTEESWQGGGFMRSKELLTGKWTDGFDEFAWGGDYTEAGPWQFRFYVPYDPQGLADLYASRDMNMCDTLEQMQTMSGVFHLGNYGTEIHEQLEMTENCWGQYAHGNQPVHHVLYMFNGLDKEGVRGPCASRGQYWLRKTQRELYHFSPKMYAGDEDNGEMAAWYVLSTLGLFSLSPGSPQYIFGTPLFSEVEIKVSSANSDETDAVLRILATNNSPTNMYIQKVSWNGLDISHQNGISYELIRHGGELIFEMGSTPYLYTNSANKA